MVMLSPAEELGLSGLSLDSRVRKVFYSVPPARVVQIMGRMQEESARRNLVYMRNGQTEVIRVLLRPIGVMPEQLSYLHTVTLTLLNALKRLPDLYLEDPAVREIVRAHGGQRGYGPNARAQHFAVELVVHGHGTGLSGDEQLQAADAAGCKTKLITTDGVFSMDGFIAPLDEITALAKKYNALVHIDECHATGFLGATGRGSAEVKGVLDRIDIITGTLGKAMGGALGGFTTARKEVIELLRQRSRPYLFSNSLPPHVVAAGIKAFEMLAAAGDLRERLVENTRYFREKMTAAGFDIRPGVHPISPVMLYDAPLAQKFAERLLEEGIYAIGFFFPVVPQGKARIRTQMSAAHTREHLDRAIDAFTRIGRELGVIEA